MYRIWLSRVVVLCYLAVASLATVHAKTMMINDVESTPSNGKIFVETADCHKNKKSSSGALSDAACQISCSALSVAIAHSTAQHAHQPVKMPFTPAVSQESQSYYTLVERHPPKLSSHLIT